MASASTDPPPEAFATIGQIVEAAREQLDRATWDFAVGGAGSEATIERNRAALDSLALRPRVLRDVSQVDTAGSLLGQSLRIPVVLAPVGSIAAIAAEGALGAVRAAAEFGTLAAVSSINEPGVEAIAAATAGPKICQLHIPGDETATREAIDRIAAAGYCALAITVDSAYYGRRERQLRGGWSEMRSDRSWQARLTWEWLDRIRTQAGIPLVVKGIQTAEDALLAVEHGVDVVWVSNHGGRQLDQAEATMDVLPEVVAAVDGRAEVVVDGAFLHGTDVAKAVALGAGAVGIGRLAALALAAGGAPLLVRALEILEDELRIALGLLGVTCLAELDASHVRPSRHASSAGSAWRILRER